MATEAYLDTHLPASPQFRDPRREDPSGVVVVHTAENIPDWVAFDGGAEAVARFIATRMTPGSYHDLADSDSAIQMVRYDCEAFHDGTGSNRHSYGVSVATRADVWPLAPQAWRDGAVAQAAAAAARYAHWLHARRGIVIPAKRINRAESEMRIPGFISHAERDPTRRHDPGAGFPWDDFLDEYARLTADLQPQEDDFMALFANVEEFEAAVRRAVEAEFTTAGDPTRTAVLELARRGALYGQRFLVIPDDFAQGGTVYYTDLATKVGFPQGGPQHTQIKADLAAQGLSTKARELPASVLAAIPDDVAAEVPPPVELAEG